MTKKNMKDMRKFKEAEGSNLPLVIVGCQISIEIIPKSIFFCVSFVSSCEYSAIKGSICIPVQPHTSSCRFTTTWFGRVRQWSYLTMCMLKQQYLIGLHFCFHSSSSFLSQAHIKRHASLWIENTIWKSEWDSHLFEILHVNTLSIKINAADIDSQLTFLRLLKK